MQFVIITAQRTSRDVTDILQRVSRSVKKMCDLGKRRVIVVGGGLAGLAAVGVLCHDERFEVTLLEASPLLGGRVRTSDQTSVPLPMGATYFHGEKNNSLIDLAIQHGIVKQGEGRVYPGSEGTTLHLLSDGTRLPNSLVASHESLFHDILEDVDYDEEDAQTRSLCDVVAKEFLERASTECDHETITSPEYSTKGLLENFLYNEGIMEGSKRLEDVDVLRYDDYVWMDRSYDFYFDGNPMQDIVDFIVKQLPQESLQVNCEVESIMWNQEQCPHPITVRCTNGDQYSADHVITTVSLGVLKNKLNSPFFTPPLPEDKQEAIASLGYGTVNKIVLEFSEPLLEENFDSIHVYHEGKLAADKSSWVQGLYRFHLIPNKRIVNVWLADEHALAVEELNESEIGKGICHVLESVLHKPIPDPSLVATTRWHSDPLYCGSYSYPAIGSDETHRGTLAAPVNGSTPLQLMFAGEATHSSLFSTANAAYDTGITTAKTLIEFLDKL